MSVFSINISQDWLPCPIVPTLHRYQMPPNIQMIWFTIKPNLFIQWIILLVCHSVHHTHNHTVPFHNSAENHPYTESIHHHHTAGGDLRISAGKLGASSEKIKTKI